MFIEFNCVAPHSRTQTPVVAEHHTTELPAPPRKKSILVHNPNATNNVNMAHDAESVKSNFSHGTYGMGDIAMRSSRARVHENCN